MQLPYRNADPWEPDKNDCVGREQNEIYSGKRATPETVRTISCIAGPDLKVAREVQLIINSEQTIDHKKDGGI